MTENRLQDLALTDPGYMSPEDVEYLIQTALRLEEVAGMAQHVYLAWLRNPSPDNLDGPMAALSSTLDHWDSYRETAVFAG